MLKESKSLKEIRKIRDELYEEEKNLTNEERIAKTKVEVKKFEKEFGIKLKRVY